MSHYIHASSCHPPTLPCRRKAKKRQDDIGAFGKRLDALGAMASSMKESSPAQQAAAETMAKRMATLDAAREAREARTVEQYKRAAKANDRAAADAAAAVIREKAKTEAAQEYRRKSYEQVR